jgi:hypothetical protein
MGLHPDPITMALRILWGAHKAGAVQFESDVSIPNNRKNGFLQADAIHSAYFLKNET